MKQNGKETIEAQALLESARLGSDDAFAALCERYTPMLSKLVDRFSLDLCEADVSELKQEARIAFFRAVGSYALENGAVTFGLYARVCVRNALVSHYRARKRQIPVCSFDELDEVLLSNSEEPSEPLIAAEAAEGIYRKIGAVLSPYERSVFDMYIEGESIRSMAKKLKKSEKSVSNAVYRILSKLRAAL
jgi:RNA polymerase sporulation-specific sigma factor